MIHYESNVLTYDELVVVRDFLRTLTYQASIQFLKIYPVI